MSTRSSIALVTEQGEIKSIYSHSDGYPSYMAELLKNNYASTDKVEAILAEGDVSFLAETIEASRFYNSWRGENTQANVWSNFEMWENWAESCGLEYIYLFNGSTWFWKEI
jgi:hypothetical protein